MKYIISFVFLLSLLPFLAVDARSDDLHPTLEERKQDNYDVRSQMPKLAPNNPSLPQSEARSPRDEQTPRDRQAALCDPKFGGSPDDPGCAKPSPTPSSIINPPPQGGPGPNNPPATTTSENPATSPSGEGSSAPNAVVVGLSKTSSTPFPITNIIGIICLAKGLILVKKSLKE